MEFWVKHLREEEKTESDKEVSNGLMANWTLKNVLILAEDVRLQFSPLDQHSFWTDGVVIISVQAQTRISWRYLKGLALNIFGLVVSWKQHMRPKQGKETSWVGQLTKYQMDWLKNIKIKVKKSIKLSN